MRHILIVFFALMLTGCTGDNVNKYFIKGGGIDRGDYKFNMMEISDISSNGDYSEALFCPANNNQRCIRLGYDGDLSDFEENQYVNIKVSDLKISEIGGVWFTTHYFYILARAFLLPHVVSLFLSYYIFTPIMLLVMAIFVAGFGARRKK